MSKRAKISMVFLVASLVLALTFGAVPMYADSTGEQPPPANAAVTEPNAWTVVKSVSNELLFSIWGDSATGKVFAVGDQDEHKEGTVLFYDGKTWTKQSSGAPSALCGVWGSAADDVFAVGLLGTAIHFDGKKWSKMETGIESALLGVWGTSDKDVYAVGDQGVILHYDGKAWSPVESHTEYGLFGVWGTGPDNVYIFGSCNLLLHFDGKTWSNLMGDLEGA